MTEQTPSTLAAKSVRLIERTGLAIILLATLVAIGQEVWVMVQALRVTLADLLLLFIYLEVVAMVGIYYQSHRLPVRFPLYIAMVALARYVILDSKTLSALELIAVGVTILILALAVLVVRFGHLKLPYRDCE
jgi:protein PsiE